MDLKWFVILIVLLLIEYAATFRIYHSHGQRDFSLQMVNTLEQLEKIKTGEPPLRQSIVLIAGFENFNLQLYRQAAEVVEKNIPDIRVEVFTDTDILERPAELEDALLNRASVLFCSLIFDYQQVEWIKPRINNIQHRFVFESALELMSETRIGEFSMVPKDGGGGGGMPAPVKAVLSKFGSNKEEDKMAGYLSFLKIAPKLLKALPIGAFGQKVSDLRAWLTVYSYWNEGALQNVVSMLYTIVEYFGLSRYDKYQLDGASEMQLTHAEALQESPQFGFFHPLLFDERGYVANGEEYVRWYTSTHPWVDDATPRVGVLLYRKHVVSEQGYIPNLITLMESQGIMPVPVFISGVEGHVVVRDLFTTRYEQRRILAHEQQRGETLQDSAVYVDVVVNTIGFPLVGGPAGSMEGGRGIEAAREILTNKNIPYIVAAPLLIQDVTSWSEKGVQGLQTVVLYSLPELDGGIDTVVLGGLVGGDKIVILPERVRKLTNRIKKWVTLRLESPSQRKIAFIVYGFPPNVGAVGTAALLNVGASLQNIFDRMIHEGYFLGRYSPSRFDTSYTNSTLGEALIRALSQLSQDAVAYGPIEKAQSILDDAGINGAKIVRREVPASELRSWLGKTAAGRMENQWGELDRYAGLGALRTGSLLLQGIELGNVFIAVQPLLGVEGDPMRMLFERDLTPHPQYAAFYLWLLREYDPNCMVHFGMHGTVEWLPGSPLGNTADSWPDILLGDTPNLYVYACNNPSESILAKRRGYATIVSHNVPPYAKSGLYKELSQLRELLADFRELEIVEVGQIRTNHGNVDDGADMKAFITTGSAAGGSSSSAPSSSMQGGRDIIPLIIGVVDKAGIFDDLPYSGKVTDEKGLISVDFAESALKSVNAEEFVRDFYAYAAKLTSYLSELEGRLFSEGLHDFGGEMDASKLVGYLSAVCGEGNDALVSSSPAPLLSTNSLHEIASSALEVKSHEEIYRGESSVLFKQRLLLKARYALNKQKRQLRGGSMAPNPPDKSDFYTNMKNKFSWMDDQSIFGIGLLAGCANGEESGSIDVMGFLRYQYLRLLETCGSDDAKEAVADVIAAGGFLSHSSTLLNHTVMATERDALQKVASLTEKLVFNPQEEIDGLIRGLGGEYIPANGGGDIIRDGVAVLPTGRNIHALDPYRIPSAVALSRGRKAAEDVLRSHREKNNGVYPETVAVTLWGLETIKTKGESVGIILCLVGAEPVREGTGRIVGFKLIPLSELRRPRIDVLGSLSGIFRDSFGNLLDLLDALFAAASDIDEPCDMNFIKKHTADLRAKGVDRPYSRLFSNPPGDFGSMVNEQVGSGEWSDSSELGSTWQRRNGFSYGAAGEKGIARPELLGSLLNTTDRIVQEVDCVEYGLTDIQEYYANTGAIKKAAMNNRSPGIGRPSDVGVSIIEAFEKNVKSRELEDVLRAEYRTKLLNPRWKDAMLKQGSAGAYEISGRMTAMIGWAATAGYSDQWVWEGTAQTYLMDEEVAETLRKSNPEAFRNMAKRMLEGAGRGFWTPDENTKEKLQQIFDDIEDEIEGI